MGLITNSLQFSGDTYTSIVITKIATGTTVLDSDNNSLATNQVVKTYVDTTIVASGGTEGVTSLSTALSSEIITRGSVDTSLSTALSSEITTRGSADTSLSTAVGTKLPLVGGTISGSLTITGDLLVSGTTTTVRTQDLLVDDNYITINYGEPGSGVTRQTSGIIVDRGGWTDYMFEFSESTDTFRIGQSGDTQAVATREDSPTNNGFAIWDSGTTKFVTQTSPTLITSLSTAVSTEISTRGSADTSLSTAISTEVSTRGSADTSLSTAGSSGVSRDTSLSTAVSTEISTRGSADTTLSTSISTETSSRISGDGSLTTALSNEISTRSSVDSSLSTAVAGATGNVTKVGTPADNQVGVWTGNGTIEGTTGLTWDGNNLGIGTTTPYATLHSAYPSGARNVSLTYNTASAAIIENWGVQLAMGVHNGGAGSQPFYLQARQSANAAWNLSLNPLGGNVGIGTMSPGAKLEVAGDIKLNKTDSNSDITFVGNQTNGLTYSLRNVRGGVSNVGFEIYDITNSACRLSIDGSGNIGIGIASPSSKLTVIGDINLPFADNWRYIMNTGASGGLKLGTGNGSGTYTDNISMSAAGNYITLHQPTTIVGVVTCRDYVQVLNTSGAEGFKIQWNNTDKCIDYIIN